MKIQSFLLTGSLLLSAVAQATAAAESPSGKIGVYDSRVVAYAHFWSEPERAARDALMAAARAAKQTDAARFKELSAQLAAAQKRSHLQVFSTAPADEAMAALKDKLPALQQELGVGRLASAWDEAALKDVPAASRVDVTDRLVQELLPKADDKQKKTIAEMKKAKPMPLAKAKELAEAGKL
ncbi:MAG: hypothetical protein HZA93_18745 [Verrucomicrobia bacterium]|nr:hypothetical protein [Verrucomicrobiota bacterium]